MSDFRRFLLWDFEYAGEFGVWDLVNVLDLEKKYDLPIFPLSE